MNAEPLNEVRLAGQLVERASLRYTPVGIPVLGFRLAHRSAQIEAGHPRKVECEVAAVVMGPMAKLLAAAPMGAGLAVTGFLAARSRASRSTVLHVNRIEFVEGNANGIQAEEQDPEQEAQG